MYEHGIVSGLRNHVCDGDDVVIVGGGWGVSSVVAARHAGPDGSITTYEASRQSVEYIKETAALNGMADDLTVENAIVSHVVATLETDKSETVISPSDLPECDVLELDCEGVELDILDEMEIEPRVVIVESHGMYGSPTEEVVDRMNSMSYRLVSRKLAEKGSLKEFCVENDIRVVTGVRQ